MTGTVLGPLGAAGQPILEFLLNSNIAIYAMLADQFNLLQDQINNEKGETPGGLQERENAYHEPSDDNK